MIITVTFSPAVDYIVDLDAFSVGEINRAKTEKILPGGKGINVSRVLNNLGMRSVATGFLAGFTGQYIEDKLTEEGIRTDFVHISGTTRVNWKIKSPTETAINGIGPIPTKEDLDKLFAKIFAYGSRDEDGKQNLVCFCSKLPGQMDPSALDPYFKRLNELGIDFMVDYYGEALLTALKYRPFFVKPNKEEIEETLNVKIESYDDAIRAGETLKRMGAKNVIVSLGSKGAVLCCGDDGGDIVPCPEGKVINTVGSGDSLVAGFVYGIQEGKNVHDSIRLAVACGSASAFSEDLATKEEVVQIIQREFPKISL